MPGCLCRGVAVRVLLYPAVCDCMIDAPIKAHWLVAGSRTPGLSVCLFCPCVCPWGGGPFHVTVFKLQSVKARAKRRARFPPSPTPCLDPPQWASLLRAETHPTQHQSNQNQQHRERTRSSTPVTAAGRGSQGVDDAVGVTVHSREPTVLSVSCLSMRPTTRSAQAQDRMTA